MLGSGFGLYAVEASKREKNRRNKRKPFDKSLHYYKDEGIKKEFPKASEAQLEAIRKKIHKENQKERRKLIIAFIIGIPVSIVLVISIVMFWNNVNI